MTPTKAIIAGLFVVAGAMPATAEILLGASISATGPAGALGDPEAKTLEMLVEELNGKGGINGETVKLVLYDDAGDPNKARTFATRLVEDDEVVAIIGGTTTGTSMSILAIAEDAGIPFISLAGAIDDRGPLPSPDVDALLSRHIGSAAAAELSEIADHLIDEIAAEGRAILDEGVAFTPSDIDLVEIHGYGFPRWKGGPMFATGLVAID